MVRSTARPAGPAHDEQNGRAGANGHAEKEQPALLKTGFARQTKKYIQLMDKLRACGIAADADIPTIAILGNQSSGKSSVIEAISGIALPRAQGTCTRCPTEVRLNRKNCDWTCRVSLRYDKNSNGVANERVRELPFGDDIKEPSAVTERLQRAQLALLSGQSRLDTFLKGSIESLPQSKLSFTESTVCINIWGPDCVDLSFIDLPGIIVYSNDAANSDVDTVEQMARKTVGHDNCLILLTITCTDDIQNQSGPTLARDVDPAGKRTIGVLTKPDRIDAGDHDAWLDILEGRSHPLALGYYVVKNPGTVELEQGISNVKARQAETAFFRTSPWNKLSKIKVGTMALAQKLSTLLEQSINEKLPGLINALRTKLDETRRGLAILPAPIVNGQAEVVRLCQSLSKEIQDIVDEDPRRPEFYRSLRDEAFAPFVDQVQKSPPIFFERADQVRNVENASLYAVKARSDYGSGFGKTIAARDPIVTEHFKQRQRVVCLIEDVRKRKREGTTFELPGNSPYYVKRHLIKQAIEHWPHLAWVCFDKCKQRLEKVIKELLDAKFGSHTSGGLYAKVGEIAADLLEQCEKQFRYELDKLICLEQAFVYTNGTTSFLERREYYLEQLRTKSPDRPNVKDLDESQKATLNEALLTLNKMSVPAFKQMKMESLLRACPSDEYEQERELCAEILAYFDIAGRRITDTVPMAIVVHFVQAFGTQLQDTLSRKLGVHEEGGAARCDALLAEAPELSAKRTELLAQRDRLILGLDLTRSFGAS